MRETLAYCRGVYEELLPGLPALRFFAAELCGDSSSWGGSAELDALGVD